MNISFIKHNIAFDLFNLTYSACFAMIVPIKGKAVSATF